MVESNQKSKEELRVCNLYKQSFYIDAALAASYRQALQDTGELFNRPNAPMVTQLCKPKYLEQIMNFLIEHMDEFRESPSGFTKSALEFNMHFEIVGTGKKAKLKLWRE